MTKILFVDKLPQVNDGHYIHYYFEKYDSPMVAIDLKKVINENIESWMNDLNDWFHAFCLKNNSVSSIWWTLYSSRIIAWDPPIFQPLYFALAISKYLEKNSVEKLYVLGAPDEVLSYLNEFHPELETESNLISTEKRNNGLLIFKTICIYMVKLFLRSFSNINYKIPKGETYNHLVYSQIINPILFRESGDHFFGKMFLENNSKDLFIYLGNLKTLDLENNFAEELTSKGKRTVIVQNMLNPFDVIKFSFRIIPYLIYFKQFKKNIGPCLINSKTSELFTKTYTGQMLAGMVPLTELEISMSICKLAEKNKFNDIIFPFEDKILERTIILDLNNKIKTIGFAHAVHNKGHLYLKEHKLEGSNPPRPDVIACTGPEAKSWLINYGNITRSKLEVFGSPRYREASGFKPTLNKLKLLYLVGTGYEVLMLANWIEENHSFFSGYELGIKVYPHNMHEMQNAGIERIKKHVPSFKVFNSILNPAIEWCDVAMFASTSAGIEAILAGKIGIITDHSHIVPMNPIEGRTLEKVIYQCKNIQELRQVIKEISAFSAEEFRNKASSQRIEAIKIYSPLKSS